LQRRSAKIEMQQMMERLLAEMEANQARMKAMQEKAGTDLKETLV
jgi:hypothetical protein